MNNPFLSTVPKVGQVVRYDYDEDTLDAQVIARFWDESEKRTELKLSDSNVLVFHGQTWNLGDGNRKLLRTNIEVQIVD